MLDNFILLDDDNEKLLEYISNKERWVTLTQNDCTSSQISKLKKGKYIETRFDVGRKLTDSWQCDVRITYDGKKYKECKEEYLKTNRRKGFHRFLCWVCEKILLPIAISILTIWLAS